MNTTDFLFRREPSPADELQKSALVICKGDGKALFSLSSPVLRGKEGAPLPLSIKSAANGAVPTKEGISLSLAAEGCDGTVTLSGEGSTLLLSLSLPLPGNAEQAAFSLSFPDGIKEILCSSLTSAWWMTTAFPSPENGGLAGVNGRVQVCYFKADDRHGMLLCLPGERFRCHVEKGILSVDAGSVRDGGRSRSSPCADRRVSVRHPRGHPLRGGKGGL